jgi:hypothetical protein
MNVGHKIMNFGNNFSKVTSIKTSPKSNYKLKGFVKTKNSNP